MDKNLKYLVKKNKELVKYIFLNAKVDTNIKNMAEEVDELIHSDRLIVPICPVSIEVGPIACHHSPILDYKILENDIMSYTVGIKNRRINIGNTKLNPYHLIKTSYTRYFKKDNDFATVAMDCARECMKAAINVCVSGAKLLDVSNVVTPILKEYNLSSVKNLCGYCLDNDHKLLSNVLPLPKLFSYCKGEMLVGEKYLIDIYITNFQKDDVVYDFPFPSIYYVPEFDGKLEKKKFLANRDKLPLASSRDIINWAYQKYSHAPFSARDVYKKFPKIKANSTKMLYERGLINIIRTKYVDLEYRERMKKKKGEKNSKKDKKMAKADNEGGVKVGNSGVILHLAKTVQISEKGRAIVLS
jgi:methionine aminopeptidase